MNSDLSAIGAALGRIPSGCSILTVEHAGRSTGVLVSWIQQAAFEPPSITVCLKRGRPAMELVDAGGRFALNVLGEDPTAMFRHFGKGFTLNEDAFAGLPTRRSEFGPILTDCVVHLGCRVTAKVPVGDHDLYVAEVAAAASASEAKPYVHLRRNGLSY